MIIKADTVSNWVFQDVDTEGLKIVLPDCTETLVKHNSPDIWWKSNRVRLYTYDKYLIVDWQFYHRPCKEN